LTDFVCPKIAESFADVKDSINISAEDLCEALAKGEEQHFHDKGNKQGDLRTTQDLQHTRGLASKVKKQEKALLRKPKSEASATRRSARQQGLKAPTYAE
jgi:hypothetical protein